MKGVSPHVAALVFWLSIMGLHAPEACAHAALLNAEPGDGAVVAAAPPRMRLTFSEPVSPLVVRLLDPDGMALAPPAVSAENAVLTVSLPRDLKRGTHMLSWRVISADGHPVGGSVSFSIGAPSAPSSMSAQNAAGTGLPVLMWAAKLAIYAGMILGVGGAVFRAFWPMPMNPASYRRPCPC
jgi:copper transport protein